MKTSRAFDSQTYENHPEQGSSPQIKKMKRTPSDEFLLTELAMDCKNITIFDISSVFMMKEQPTPYTKFKCYIDHDTKEFFIEATDTTPLETFTTSTLLNLLNTAEREGATKVFICVRQDLHDYDAFLKTFSTLEFKILSPEQQEQISMTMTHTLLEYDFAREDNDDEEFGDW